MSAWLPIFAVWLVVAPVMVVLLWSADTIHRRLHRPEKTLWKSVCMIPSCRRVYQIHAREYDPRYGPETETTGLCLDCDREMDRRAARVVDFDSSRETVKAALDSIQTGKEPRREGPACVR